jgi:hypothetical protein
VTNASHRRAQSRFYTCSRTSSTHEDEERAVESVLAYAMQANGIRPEKGSCSCKFFSPTVTLSFPRNEVSTGGEERSREPRKFCQRRNRARNDHVVARWACGYELFCSCLNDAKPRRESARRSDCFKEASLLPSRFNQVKRCARTRMKEACCERNPRESATTAEICKRAAVWR